MVKQKAYFEAVKIADQLDKLAIWDGETLFWNTYDPYSKWKERIGIYTGVSGILLFYLDLYLSSENKQYLNILKYGANRLLKYSEEYSTDFSLFTGKSGVIYVLSKINQILPDPRYREAVVKIVLEIEQNIESISLNELLRGKSGISVSLIEALVSFEDENIRRLLRSLILSIKNEVKFHFDGIYFDDDFRSSQPLTGLSHGTSGPLALFAELGIVFNDTESFWIVENLLKYEGFSFDQSEANWYDYRLLVDTESYHRLYDSYKRYGFEAFEKKQFVFAWCHGAPGIVLARLRYLIHTDQKEEARKFMVQFVNRLNKDADSSVSYTICCGSGSVIFSLLEINKYFNDPSVEECLTKCILSIIKQNEFGNGYLSGWPGGDLNNDISLFKGSAGIGMIYLRYYNRELKSSIMLPNFDKSLMGGRILDIPKMDKGIIVQKHFLNSSKIQDCSKLFELTSRLSLPIEDIFLDNTPTEIRSRLILDIEVLKKLRNLNLPFVLIGKELNRELLGDFDKELSLTEKQFILRKSEGIIIHDNTIHLFDESGAISQFEDPDDVYTLFLSILTRPMNLCEYIDRLMLEIESDIESKSLLLEIIVGMIKSNLIYLRKVSVEIN